MLSYNQEAVSDMLNHIGQMIKTDNGFVVECGRYLIEEVNDKKGHNCLVRIKGQSYCDYNYRDLNEALTRAEEWFI